MNLIRYRLLSKDSDKYYKTSFSSFPFSLINVTKIKSKIYDNVKEFKDKEEKCISLIDFNILSEIKKKETEDKKSNNIDNSSNSEKSISNKKQQKNISIKEKNSFMTVNSADKKAKNYFPLIIRNKRKIKTTSLFKNNLNENRKLRDLFLENSNSQKMSLNRFMFNKEINNYEFINCKENNESKTNNSLSSLNRNKSHEHSLNKLTTTELFSNNKIKESKNNLNTHNFFSLRNNNENNNLISLNRNLKKSKSTISNMNLKFLKNKKTTSYSFTPSLNNKSNLNNTSNKSLKNCKTLSILKSPIDKKDSFNSKNSNKNNFFLTSNIEEIISNQSNQQKTNSSILSSYETKLVLKTSIENDSNNINQEKNISLQKQKKLFKLMIVNKINELDKELKKNMKESNNNNKVNNLIIKYMIKKCKRVLKKIDEKMNFEIDTLLKEFDKDEVYNNLKNKKGNLSILLNKVENIGINRLTHEKKFKKMDKNAHLIYNLLDKNNQIEQKVNDYLDKLIDKSKPLIHEKTILNNKKQKKITFSANKI